LKRTHERWWETKNVVGLCAARKQSGGAFGPVSLQVLVRKKRASGKLAPSERIPKQISGGGAGYDGGIPTDVLQVGPGRLESLASATRPEHPGYNIGNEEDGSGTLCCVVRSRQPGHSRLGLSCCHVIGRYGDALDCWVSWSRLHTRTPGEESEGSTVERLRQSVETIMKELERYRD